MSKIHFFKGIYPKDEFQYGGKMINHKYKCIFVHIPRTGGTSIEAAFEGPEGKAKSMHCTAQQMQQLAGESIWNEYFKFSFVRNPWDLIITLYHASYFRKINSKSGKSLLYFLQNYEKPAWEHGVTFCSYLNFGEMDFIGRFENRKCTK